MSFPNPTLVELFDHIIDGYDIPKPSGLSRMRREVAVAKPEGAPYSPLTNLAHTVLWQEAWLKALIGVKTPGPELWNNDFRVPDSEEYEALRKRFIDGLREARAYAAGETAHKCASDEKAVTTLLKIAVHASYHMGQLNLLRRVAKAK